jgi:hypothetical protein
MAQPDRLQIKIWHCQTGYRRKYGSAKQATDKNMAQPDKLQMKI